MPLRRKALTAAIAALSSAAWAPAAGAAPPPGPPTFADEFNGIALDAGRWSHRASGPRNDGILTPDAVSVGGGLLTIKTYTEAGQNFSGMISTARTGATGFEQTYGYFEARVRFNSAPGQWSAFWLQSQTIGNPIGDPATAGVEMDIAEHRARCVVAPAPTAPETCSAANDITNRIQQALIWDGYGADSKAAVKLSDPLTGLANDSFHTWALRWSPTDLTFFYDDVAIWSLNGPISRRSQYMVLSSEVGQFFAGTIPPGGYGTRVTSTTNMQVDYVRVWALPAVNRTAPVASGTPAVGQPLTCSTGTWDGDPAPGFTYEWLSDGAPIAAATAPGYTVQSADQGRALSCLVTATNAGGATVAQSNALSIPAPPPPPVTLPLAPAARLAVPPPPPVPPFNPPAVDHTAPAALLSGSRSQHVRGPVAVTVLCPDEACLAAVASSVRVPRVGRARARTYTQRVVTRPLAKATRLTVRLTLSKRARVAIGRALRARKRVFVTVRVRVADSAGNVRSLTRRVALRR